jgi:hypothetical protein
MWCLSGVQSVAAQRTPPDAAELRQRGQALYEEMMRELDPDLLKRAVAKGIYRYEEYPMVRSKNPFFLRGDFNGDGTMDVAFWVTQQSSGRQGIAVIHSTLDSVYYLGAGNRAGSGMQDIGADAWHVLPAGTTLSHVRETVPAIGAVDGRPFTFQREALQCVYLGKSSYVYYWANGRYWHIGTAD